MSHAGNEYGSCERAHAAALHNSTTNGRFIKSPFEVFSALDDIKTRECFTVFNPGFVHACGYMSVNKLLVFRTVHILATFTCRGVLAV